MMILLIIVVSIAFGLLLEDLKTVFIIIWSILIFAIISVKLIDYAKMLDQRSVEPQIEKLPKEFFITDSTKKIQAHWVHDSLLINNFK